MDIKNKEAFESKFKLNAIYERESRIRKNNILEFAETAGIYFNIVTNNAWELWQAAQAQAVPEGFVLVPKERLANVVDGIEKLFEEDCTLALGELLPIQQDLKAIIEVQEPAPLKLGDLVKPIDHRYTLASGCERYPYAYVVNTNPFQLMSEEGDMYWCCTVEAGGYKLIKSNNQLPEAVSLRMIREGLLAPVEAQEQSHD